MTIPSPQRRPWTRVSSSRPFFPCVHVGRAHQPPVGVPHGILTIERQLLELLDRHLARTRQPADFLVVSGHLLDPLLRPHIQQVGQADALDLYLPDHIRLSA